VFIRSNASWCVFEKLLTVGTARGSDCNAQHRFCFHHAELNSIQKRGAIGATKMAAPGVPATMTIKLFVPVSAKVWLKIALLFNCFLIPSGVDLLLQGQKNVQYVMQLILYAYADYSLCDTLISPRQIPGEQTGCPQSVKMENSTRAKS
jgi:hypothetical protein